MKFFGVDFLRSLSEISEKFSPALPIKVVTEVCLIAPQAKIHSFYKKNYKNTSLNMVENRGKIKRKLRTAYKA